MVEVNIYDNTVVRSERMFNTPREQLVDRLIKDGYIKSESVKKAFFTGLVVSYSDVKGDWMKTLYFLLVVSVSFLAPLLNFKKFEKKAKK